MITIKKLYDDLDYWNMNNMASDIYECKTMRPEYLPLVLKAESLGYHENDIVLYVLAVLKRQSLRPWYQRNPSFQFHLIKINLRYFILNCRKKIVYLKIKLKG